MKKKFRRLAVLLSGEGTTLEAIIDAIKLGNLEMEISMVITNNSNSFALGKVRREGIDYRVLNEPSDEEQDELIYSYLKMVGTDIVLSAGYLRHIGPKVRREFTVINTHPSLLPKYGGKGMYGIHVHKAVVDNHEKETGATVHFVNENYDEGQIIWQTKVPVYVEDDPFDVSVRVKAAEKVQLVSILKAFSEGKIDIPEN